MHQAHFVAGAPQQVGQHVCGLAVVVGYAGLLDLGYVAFWALGFDSDAVWTAVADVSRPQTTDSTLP